MSTERSADLVILGGGSGGYSCALRAAILDMSVVLVEKNRLLCGTCPHCGCIPTKALLHAAEIADRARAGADIGVLSRLDGIDMVRINAYEDGVVARLHKGLEGLATRKVELITGTGTLVGPHSVEVAGTRYTGRSVVLATGSHHRTPPGLEVSGRVVMSDQALALDVVPERVVVLGGGVIGVEFVSMWRSLGADVVVIEARDRPVPGEDELCSNLLKRAFRRRGIAVRTGVSFTGAAADDHKVTITLDSGEQQETDLLLVAIGRGPNIAGHGYAEAGLARDRGWVVTDERLRTNLDAVRAVGDIVAGPQLAHRGFQQGIFVAEDIAGLAPREIDERDIPHVKPGEVADASLGWRFTNPRLRDLDRRAPLDHTETRGPMTSSMGETAEEVAALDGITRAQCDEFAQRSHARAVAASRDGRSDVELIPVAVPQRKGDAVVITADEGPRSDATIDTLGRMQPVFQVDGVVTAGTSSPLSDGAAAVVVASARAVAQYGLEPIARIVGGASAGVAPHLMGLGPVPASQRALERAGVGRGPRRGRAERGVRVSDAGLCATATPRPRHRELRRRRDRPRPPVGVLGSPDRPRAGPSVAPRGRGSRAGVDVRRRGPGHLAAARERLIGSIRPFPRRAVARAAA